MAWYLVKRRDNFVFAFNHLACGSDRVLIFLIWPHAKGLRPLLSASVCLASKLNLRVAWIKVKVSLRFF